MRFLRSRKIVKQDDATIIAAYRNSSDNMYLGILFDRYCHLVFAVAMNYLKNEEDSKDAVIHVFEKLSVDLKKYDVKNFSHWIHSVTKNYCLRQLNKKMFTVSLNDESKFIPANNYEQDATLTEQLLLHLEEALSTLNEEQRKCIKLFYLEEKSYKEIESLTGYQYDKVKSYIQNGKRNLRIYLSEKMNRDKKHRTIFSGTHHFTSDELIRYCHHLLNEQEQHEMEKHLVDCELCSEALKGVAELENASLMYEVNNDLRLRARRKHILKKTIFSQNEMISIFAVVFLILFLLLMTVFFFTKKDLKKVSPDENKIERKN